MEAAAGEEGAIPVLGGGVAFVGVLVEELLEDLVGVGGAADLEAFGEGDAGGVVARVEFVGVGEVEEAFGHAALLEGEVGLVEEECAAHLGHAVPERRQREVDDADRVADPAEENEDREAAGEVGGEETGAV